MATPSSSSAGCLHHPATPPTSSTSSPPKPPPPQNHQHHRHLHHVIISSPLTPHSPSPHHHHLLNTIKGALGLMSTPQKGALVSQSPTMVRLVCLKHQQGCVGLSRHQKGALVCLGTKRVYLVFICTKGAFGFSLAEGAFGSAYKQPERVFVSAC
ncbi:hypothetical protein Tco_1258743 [Tanacetum coccineum]